jgi:hypothetical protein
MSEEGRMKKEEGRVMNEEGSCSMVSLLLNLEMMTI